MGGDMMKQKYLFLILTGLFLIFLIGCQQQGRATEQALYYPPQSQYDQYPMTAQEQYYYERDISYQYPFLAQERYYYEKFPENVLFSEEGYYASLINLGHPSGVVFLFRVSGRPKREGGITIIEDDVYEDSTKKNKIGRIRRHFYPTGRCFKEEFIYEPYEITFADNSTIFCVHKKDVYENCDDVKIYLRTEIVEYEGRCNDIANWKRKSHYDINRFKDVTPRLLNVTTRDGGNKNITNYDEKGEITRFEEIKDDGSKNVTEYKYDEFGAWLETKVTKYDKDGNKKEEILDNQHGRRVIKYREDGTVTTCYYDDEGNFKFMTTKKETTDASGNKTIIEKIYDSQGNCKGLNILKYDALGNLLPSSKFYRENDSEVLNEPSINTNEFCN
jgi:hypothetical protein